MRVIVQNTTVNNSFAESVSVFQSQLQFFSVSLSFSESASVLYSLSQLIALSGPEALCVNARSTSSDLVIPGLRHVHYTI